MAITPDTIRPVPGGTYPVALDTELYAGVRVVDTTEDRNSIPPLRRKIGMRVIVNADGLIYRLTKNNPNSVKTLDSDWEVDLSSNIDLASDEDIRGLFTQP